MWWIVQKDLVSDFRSCRVWPRMVATAAAVTFLLSYQMVQVSVYDTALLAATLWVATGVASAWTLGGALLFETRNDCLSGLLQSGVHSRALFAAKLCTGVVELGAVQLMVTMALVLAFGSPIRHPVVFVGMLLAGNVGLNSVSILGGATLGNNAVRRTLSAVLLPALVPILLTGMRVSTLAWRGAEMDSLARVSAMHGLSCAVVAVVAFTCFELLLESD